MALPNQTNEMPENGHSDISRPYTLSYFERVLQILKATPKKPECLQVSQVSYGILLIFQLSTSLLLLYTSANLETFS